MSWSCIDYPTDFTTILLLLPFVGYAIGYYVGKGESKVDYDNKVKNNVKWEINPIVEQLSRCERSIRLFLDADITSSNKYIRKIVRNYDSSKGKSEIEYLYGIYNNYKRKEISSKWIIRIAIRRFEYESLDNDELLDWLKYAINNREIIVEEILQDISVALADTIRSINDRLLYIYPYTEN